MDDYKDFRTDSEDRDEWADEFFSNVLSGSGRGKARSGLYGQFDVIDRMARGIETGEDGGTEGSAAGGSRPSGAPGERAEGAPADRAPADGSSAVAAHAGAASEDGPAETDGGVSDVHIGAGLFGDTGKFAEDAPWPVFGDGGRDKDKDKDRGTGDGPGAGTDDGEGVSRGGGGPESVSQTAAAPSALSAGSADTAASVSSAGSVRGGESGSRAAAPEGTEGLPGGADRAAVPPDASGGEAGNTGDAGSSRMFAVISIIAVILLIVLAAICGFFLGKIAGKATSGVKGNSVDFTYENVDSRQIAKLQTIYRFICDNYYEDVDADELLEGAVRGMTDALGDPYGSYYRPGKMVDYTDFVDGRYNGVGIEIVREDGRIYVIDVTEDSPASLSGFLPGDEIVSVNGREVALIETAELKDIFSSVGTEFTCRLKNEDGVREVRCTPQPIVRKTVRMERRDDGVVYIKIDQFIDGTAAEFKNALKEASSEVVSGFIIDLRDNPGGFVNEAVMISDIILPEGPIAFAKQRDGKIVRTYDSDANHIDAPMVLLVNGRTASSAELLTGAFRDFDAGEIVGTSTYGKALAQITHEFDYDGSGIVLSAYRYYTPSGECIDGLGIKPTVEIVLPSRYEDVEVEAIPEGEDLQYLKAVEIVMSSYPED